MALSRILTLPGLVRGESLHGIALMNSWNYSSGGYAYDVEDSTVYLDIALARSINFDVRATEAAIVTFV